MAKATTVTVKGQVTIPVAVRQALGLKPHDRVTFEIDADAGTATLRPVPSVASVYGAVEPRRRPEDFRQLREEFEQGVSDEVAGEG
jgi:antitoxin PrlF